METPGAREAGRRARARWLMPRAVGPLAAVPVAALAATICAVAVLAQQRDDAAATHRARVALRSPVARSPEPERRIALAPPTPAPLEGERAAPRAVTTADRAAILSAALSADETARADAIPGLRVLGPDPAALDALARLVEDPAAFVSAEAAMTLASTPDGRRLVVGRLRGGDDPGLVHVVCIEALRDFGAPDDVPTLERLVATEGPVGDAAASAVRAICARAGVESPLPEPEPLGEPRPDRD